MCMLCFFLVCCLDMCMLLSIFLACWCIDEYVVFLPCRLLSTYVYVVCSCMLLCSFSCMLFRYVYVVFLPFMLLFHVCCCVSSCISCVFLLSCARLIWWFMYLCACVHLLCYACVWVCVCAYMHVYVCACVWVYVCEFYKFTISIIQERECK